MRRTGPANPPRPEALPGSSGRPPLGAWATGSLTTEAGAQPDAFAVRFDNASMHLEQPFHQSEPDTQPAACVLKRKLELPEHLEHLAQQISGDADPAVAYGDQELVAPALCRQPNAPTRVRELGGIVSKLVKTWAG